MPQITAEKLRKAKEGQLKRIQDGGLEPHFPSVLFVGLSKSGKSTIIKYLLELGACQEEADSIEASDEFCRRTRQTTYYNARLSFTDRRLSYENGRRVLIETDDEKDVDFEGYFVDTPGLDCDEIGNEKNELNMAFQNGLIDFICVVYDSREPLDDDTMEQLLLSTWDEWGKYTLKIPKRFIQTRTSIAGHFGEEYNQPIHEANFYSFPYQNPGDQEPIEAMQRSSMIQFLKSLLLDKHLSAQGDRVPNESILTQKYTVLREAMNSVLACVQKQLNEAQAEQTRLGGGIQELKGGLAQAFNTTTAAQDRLDFLGTQDLEELSFFRKEHKWNPLSPTPDFNFDLNTNFPIRHVEANVPEKSVWLSFPVYPDAGYSTRFTATLKNRRVGSATAHVKLFGWRREIHAEEISQHLEALERLVEFCSVAYSQLEAHGLQLQHVELNTARFVTELEQIASDVRLLNLIHLQSWDLDLMRNCLDMNNTYGVAHCIGLISAVHQSYTVSPSVSQKLNSPYPNDFFRIHRGMCEDLHRYQSENKEKLASTRKRGDEETSILSAHCETLYSRRQTVAWEDDQLQKMTGLALLGTPHEKSIAQPALETLKDLNSQFSEFMIDQREKFTELLGLRNDVSRLNDAMDAVDELMEETLVDIETDEEMARILDGWPIGVFASFMEGGSVVESWDKIWNGVRAAKVRER